MNPERPYFNSSITELESLFQENRGDKKLLARLLKELAHRKRPKAKKLLEQVEAALGEFQEPDPGRAANSRIQLFVDPEMRRSPRIDLVKKADRE